MKEFLSQIEDGVSQFEWLQESVLRDFSELTDCKDVFNATCQEIGNYYSRYGLKVFKKKIQFKLDDFKIEVLFSSSGYNQKGKFIWLELNSGVYPTKLSKQYKKEGNPLLPILFANVTLLDVKIDSIENNDHITKGISILGKRIL